MDKTWTRWTATIAAVPRKRWAVATSVLLVVYGLPGTINDGQTWVRWFRQLVAMMSGSEWSIMERIAVIAGTLIFLYAVFPDSWLARLRQGVTSDLPLGDPSLGDPATHVHVFENKRPFFKEHVPPLRLQDDGRYTFMIELISPWEPAQIVAIQLLLLPQSLDPAQPTLSTQLRDDFDDTPLRSAMVGQNDISLTSPQSRHFVLVTMKYANKKSTQLFCQEWFLTIRAEHQDGALWPIVGASTNPEKAKMSRFLNYDF